ncbi:HypC/HybG/HupF family hydrogenase formation chaperone [Acidithrix ferrooxidans]|uniref:Uncharacterized protein n=1 Tax=Acidithrix ferrooxidans TaxID=1280514 RepID=A0A0D8HKT6_9ACTN|nr:HypC/HybG/HupF family hydrogenase formation chaperone [Acidithrix ferrooxidans]KJF18543.1 hypothetical protein AXFE_04910 [Acidithrix ferrooxidans]
MTDTRRFLIPLALDQEEPASCSVCLDDATAIEIVEIKSGFALGVDPCGNISEVAYAFIEHLAVGDVVLVQPGIALARVQR